MLQQLLVGLSLIWPSLAVVCLNGHVDDIVLKFIYILDVSKEAGVDIEYPGVDLPTLLYGLEDKLGPENVEMALISSGNKYNPPDESDNYCYRVAQYFEKSSADEIMRLMATYMAPKETDFPSATLDAVFEALNERNFDIYKDPVEWNELRIFFIDSHTRYAHAEYSREPFNLFEAASPYVSCEATNYPSIDQINKLAIKRGVRFYVAASGEYQSREGPSWAELEGATDFPVTVFYGDDRVLLANQILNSIVSLACPKVEKV